MVTGVVTMVTGVVTMVTGVVTMDTVSDTARTHLTQGGKVTAGSIQLKLAITTIIRNLNYD